MGEGSTAPFLNQHSVVLFSLLLQHHRRDHAWYPLLSYL